MTTRLTDGQSRVPLAEALLEIRWRLVDPPGAPTGQFGTDPGYPLVVGVLFERIKDRFPKSEELAVSVVPDQMTPHVVKYRFRSAGDLPFVQIGPGIATVNFTIGYTWDSFRDAILSFVPHLRNAYESTGNRLVPTSVVLRYINTMPFKSTDGDALSVAAEQLHVDIRLPRAIVDDPRRMGTPEGLVMRVGLPLSAPKSVAGVQVGTGKHGEVPSLIWDLSVASRDALAPALAESFEEWLTQAHDVMEAWFFAMISGTLEGQFGLSRV